MNILLPNMDKFGTVATYVCMGLAKHLVMAQGL